MKPTIRRQFNPEYKGSEGEINTMPSQTVPDMSLSIQELLLNHSRGIHSEIKNYEGQYFEDEIPIFHDITEMVEHKQELLDRIKEVENDIKATRAAKIKADKAKAEKAKTNQPETPQEPSEPSEE